MVSRSKTRRTGKSAFTASVLPTSAGLKQFTNGAGGHPGFTFTRYWWEGDGPRAGIRSWVEKKLAPGDDPVFGRAAKWEVLIPDSAPADYADLDFLLERFDARLQPFERHVFIQVKITLDPGESWVAGYERVRAYARSHFAGQGHPVVIVAHVPGTAGSANASHVHVVVLNRSLGINGLGEVNHRLCSDKGNADAWDSWQAHLSFCSLRR
jgi:hypothetical protein